MNAVSVIVACRDEVRHIRAFLDSLLSQSTDGIDVEFLIADGMSTDGTRTILTEYASASPALRLIDNPGLIVSTGLNAAIREARGQIIIRMDAHTEFDPGYIQACVRLLKETQAANVGGPARTKAEGLKARAIAAAYHSPFSTGGAKFHDPDYEGPVDTVTYGCWRKETLDRVGYFDEDLVRNQDDELNLRIIRSGGIIWQSPQIVSWYRPRGELRKLFRQYFQYGYWKIAVIRKHRMPASWRNLVPGLFVVSLLASVILFLAGILAGYSVLAALPLASIVTAYVLSLTCFSVHTARKAEWKILPLLPLTFAVYHVSYGLGFLTGLSTLACNASRNKPARKVFAEISR